MGLTNWHIYYSVWGENKIMDKAAKIELLMQLAQDVTNEMVVKIQEGHVPEHWSGVQIRHWMKERFAALALQASMGRKEKKDFNNDLIINNLA